MEKSHVFYSGKVYPNVSHFSFFFTPLSNALEKVSETTLPNLEVLISMDRKRCGKLLCPSDCAQFYSHKDLLFSEWSNILTFLENYPPEFEILDSIEITGCEKLPCVTDYDQFFFPQNYGPRKSQVLIFLTLFLKFFIVYRELESFFIKEQVVPFSLVHDSFPIVYWLWLLLKLKSF